jgi:hypothetical protein
VARGRPLLRQVRIFFIGATIAGSAQDWPALMRLATAHAGAATDASAQDEPAPTTTRAAGNRQDSGAAAAFALAFPLAFGRGAGAPGMSWEKRQASPYEHVLVSR